jgi:hypothetical protein
VAAVSVIILHPLDPAAGPLGRLLGEARERLAAQQGRLLLAAGAGTVQLERSRGGSFGVLLAELVRGLEGHGLIILGAGAVARLRATDAARLVAAAASGRRVALTNNRYSSDVCAVGDSRPLRDLPALPSDNALPRWLAERAGFEVAELPGRERLAFDLDSPLDLAILALRRGTPAPLRGLVREAELEVPRLGDLRARLVDPRAELLLAGRSSAGTLRWLERHAACRIRFLAEERGLRASSPLAQGTRRPVTAGPLARPPRSLLGRLLAERGPEAFAATVAELADGALVDSRVLLADRLGAGEASWPAAEERFASDLLRPEAVGDAWLRALTASARGSVAPILLGGHTLLGPAIPYLGRPSEPPSERPGRLAP